jgi:hypothetical protein
MTNHNIQTIATILGTFQPDQNSASTQFSRHISEKKEVMLNDTSCIKNLIMNASVKDSKKKGDSLYRYDKATVRFWLDRKNNIPERYLCHWILYI